MYNRITHRTALAGRLFLCPEIAVYYARPPPISVQAINQPQKEDSLCTITPAPTVGRT